MTNYFGGYYLIRLKTFDFGRLKGKSVFTCSDCFNESLLKGWSYSWTTTEEEVLKEIESDFQIHGRIKDITEWADKKLEQKKLGWINVFSDIETILEYRNKFFQHLTDVKIFSIYFPTSESDEIITEFKPKENNGTLGIWDNLTRKIVETNDPNEITIGYDLIGLELSGDFHSFNCHDMADELESKFGVTINKYGLIDEQKDWKPLTDYMNDETNGHEPVPWYVCKIKMRAD